MSETNPTAAGSETSESKSTRMVQIAAGVFAAVGVGLVELHEQFPEIIWLSIAMNIVAGLVALFAQLGIVKSRTVVKATLIQQGLNTTSIIPPPSKPNP